MNAMDRQH